MKKTMPISKRNLILSVAVIALFGLLMVFGLQRNANFTPSQLIGHLAPSFQSKNSLGQMVEFSPQTARGKWTVLNFWTSSCSVCREEAPSIQDFYQTVSLASATNPQLLSINIEDDAGAIFQWQKEFSQTFPVVQDTKGAISINYGVTGTPETFFVSPERTVRFRVAGAIHKRIILDFIAWLNAHPQATEEQAAQLYATL